MVLRRENDNTFLGIPGEALIAFLKYKGSKNDYDNDGIPNTRDASPYTPGGSRRDTIISGPVSPTAPAPSAAPGSPFEDKPYDRSQDRTRFQQWVDEAKRQGEERRSRRQVGHPTPKDPRAQSMEDFFMQMQQIMQGSAPTALQYTGPSNQELRNRSSLIAAEQYNPQIQAIARMMQETEGRAARNEVELGNLYGALAGAYEQDIPKVQQTYQGAIDQSNQQQAALQEALAADYGARTSAIDDLARSLGQEQAGAVAGEQIAADQAFLQNLERQVGASQLGALQQMQAVNTEYTRQGANLARGEGTSRRSDLRADLENYIRSRQAEISDLNSQREATAAAQYAQMLAQADEARQQIALQNTSQMNQWRSGQFGQMMDLFQMRMAMDKALQPQGPEASDILGAQRLAFDQEKALRDWVMELAKTSGLQGQELVDFINQYMGQLGVGG